MTEPLHVYLLLDISASMTGAPLEAMKQGVHLLRGTLVSRSTRPVMLSVISYESTAAEIMPLTQLAEKEEFKLPNLIAGGTSGLGGALKLLSRKLTDHQPTLIYLFTDGEPTDDWESPTAEMRSRVQRIFGLACGLSPDKAALSKIVDESHYLRDLTPDSLFMTFRRFV
jgi:uncharacterized protein YegL